MSASPMLEMSSKSMTNAREGTKKETAGSEKSFDQVLGQKINSRTAKKPQSLSPKVEAKADEAEQASTTEEATLEIDKPVAKGEGKKDTKGTEKGKKEETIKKFMDSFESEFQVPPTRLVEVISQLTPEQLNESAEQTADALIGQLNLDPTAELKAKKQYLGLIQDLNQNAVEQQKPVFIPELGMMSMGPGLTQERFQRVKSNREALQKSIDQMNQSFWQPRPAIPQMQKAVDPALMNVNPEAQADFANQNANLDLLAMQNQELMATDFENRLADNSKIAYERPALAQAKNLASTEKGRSQQQEEAEIMAALGLSSEGMSESLAPASQAEANPASMGSALNNKSADSSLLSAAGNSIPSAAKFNLSGNMKEQSKDSSSYGDSAFAKSATRGKDTKSKGEDVKNLFAAQLGLEAQVADKGKADVMAPAAPLKDLSQNEVDKNIQNVMNQAQYLVKKGGGEVSVKMTPEGLGQIHLKIEMVDGKVQMQMLTENKETKKILESNMSDLKDHLSSHKLSVESIKIDSVQGASTDVGTRNQNSSDMSQNQNQDRQTKQFWNQFQDQFGRGSQREALFDNPKVKGYVQKKSDPIAPAETVGTASVSSTKSKGLNLVA